MHVGENRGLWYILKQGRAEIRDYWQKPPCNGQNVVERHLYRHMLQEVLQRHPGGDLQSRRNR